MYHAKSLGGGRAELFDPALRRQVQQRSVAQHMLQSALDEHRVIAHYQPIVDLASNTVVSFEALARIAERDGSILSPGAFVPIAEDSGLVVRLGAQVLTTACEAAKTWRPAEGMAVAVNLSSRQFEPGDLAALVHDRLARTGLDPSCLHLELTETAVMDLRPDLLLQLKKIRDLGVEVGLDDFGTGYASLTHLRRLPLTFVKIDQSFVQGLGSDRDDDGIVSAVVDLASNLGLRSIAEGVETADQLSRLRELGCDQAQGYLFARPVPPDDVADAVVRVPRPRITGPSGGTECVSIEPAAPFPILTPREREMLNLLADGLSGPTIAEQLFLSPATVRTHIRNAMVKLGAHTRGQAIAMVLRSEQIGS
jgi:EAL domain-containing protein (putative c-di-GMP-specific phosphodiesterase class I)/DNA-binding CsgD family transcriptional regulator